jgi:hypothetical protein
LQDLKAKLREVSSGIVEDIVLELAVKVQVDGDFKDTLDMVNARINAIC